MFINSNRVLHFGGMQAAKLYETRIQQTLIRASEAAEILGINKATISAFCKARVEAVKIARGCC